MGAFGSIIAGAGQAAADYEQQARQIKLAQWGQLQDSLAKMITDAAASAITPERHLDLHALRSKVLKLKPGEDPSKVIQDVQNHLVLHPIAEKAFEPEKPQPKPGPAQPGETPGRGTLNPMAQLMSGGASQPATSPVSPQAQTSNYASQSSHMPAAAPPQQAPQAPQIAPPPISVPQAQQGLQASIIPMIQHAMQAGSMPPALEKMGQPFMANEAELARTRGMREYQLHEQAPAVMGYLRQNIPGFDQLPDFVKSQYAMSAASLQPPGMMGMASTMFNPDEDVMDARNLEARHPGILAQYRIDPNQTPQVRVKYNKMSQMANPSAPPMMVEGMTPQMGTFTDQSGGQFVGARVPGAVSGAVAPSQIVPKTVTMPDLSTGFQTAQGARQGVAPIPTGGINPAGLPTTTTSEHPVITTDAQGNQIIKVEPFTSVRTRGSGSLPQGVARPTTPTGGGRTFDRGLTPLQHLTEEQKGGQIDTALERMKSLRSQVPHMLSSMLQAGKLNLELDSSGLIKAIVNRAIPLTPGEAQFVGDFRTMMEDINLLRGPLGATGFRGPEAWAALQAQRGQLLAHPEVTMRVMDNTIQALQKQVAPINKALGKPEGSSSTPGNQPMTITLPSGKKVVIE